jgi:cytochrome bd-type quinol oxidase subunit 1
MMNKINPCLFIFLVVLSEPLYAYIGPGMAGGVIAATLGVISALFLALFGVLYYPIKRAIKNRKSKAEKKNEKNKPDEDLESA